jgi:hypothetical protein
MNLYIDTKPELEWAIGDGDIPDEAITAEGKYCIYKYNSKLVLRFENEKFRIVRLGKFESTEMDKVKSIAQSDYDRRTQERFKRVELPQDVTIIDIKRLRNYFGEHDKTLFEHRAYSLLDSILKSAQKAMEGKG